MSDTPQWNGRDVEFVEIDIAAGERVIEAAKGDDRNAAFYLTLVLSARYADDHQPLFSSVAHLRAQPFRLLQRVQQLAALAVRCNQSEDSGEADLPLDVARADVSAPARAGNGADGS